MAHERHQRGQPDAAVEACAEGVPQLVWGDVQQLPVAAAQPGGGDRVEQALTPNVDTLAKIGSLVAQFGSKSPTFSLIELPAQLGGTGFLSDYALMCVVGQYGIEEPSAVFNQPGLHRRSPWYRAAATLQLNTIEQAREKLRAWSEAAWNALDLNKGRGRMEGKTFIPMPIQNPFAQKEPAT